MDFSPFCGRKEDLQEKESTMLPYILSVVEGQAILAFA